MEIDFTQADKMMQMASVLYPHKHVEVLTDLAHKPRLLKVA